MISKKTSQKILLTELSWLIVAFALSLTASFALSHLMPGNNALDINLHDTYFVVAPSKYYFTDFVFVGFVVYLFRAIFSSYHMRSINLLLMLFNLLFIFQVVPFVFQVLGLIKPNVNGWTVYPPLSALPKAELPMFNSIHVIFRAFIGAEILLSLHLCFVSVRVGMGLRTIN